MRGVAVMLHKAGHRLVGADLLIDSDVPIGAGLSSSAALEVSTGYALLDLAGVAVDRTELALCCQRAENEFVGMRCGIMDQFVSCHGAAAHALLLDCRSLAFRLVPIAPSVRLVICNSMVRHQLAAGEYNLRRARVRARRRAAQIRAAGDPRAARRRHGRADGARGAAARADAAPLPPRRHRKRARRCAPAPRSTPGEVEEFGRLMNASHVSMRDDYEISCRELDILVELAWRVEGVLGSRMTGGGFGGCTVSMVRADAVERFRASLAAGYAAATGITPDILVCSPGDGVGASRSMRREPRRADDAVRGDFAPPPQCADARMGAGVAAPHAAALAGADRAGGAARRASLRSRLLSVPRQSARARRRQPRLPAHLRLRQRLPGAARATRAARPSIAAD